MRRFVRTRRYWSMGNKLTRAAALGAILLSGCQDSATPRPTPAASGSPTPIAVPSRPADPLYALRITGGTSTQTSSVQGTTCVLRSRHSLQFGSSAMPSQTGEVLRVQLTVSPADGNQSAVSPTPNGNTPVLVSRARSAAAADFPFWQATSGQVTVSSLQLPSDFGPYPFIYGMASGTVDAMLASSDGNRIHLTGSWACVVEIDKSVS